MASYKRRVISRLRNLFEQFVYQINTEPVIVLGYQKSGTSVIAHLLADLCGLSKTIDIPQLWPPTVTKILDGSEELSAIIAKNPRQFSRGLLKEPHLTFLYPQLSELFPCARYAFVVRDPRTNIRSLLNRLGIPGNLQTLNMADYKIPPAWQRGFDPILWPTSQTNYVGILADRWRQAARVYMTHTGMVLIKYEDFTKAKVSSIERLAGSLGLTPINDIAQTVDVQYQPPGDHSEAVEDFFGAINLRLIESLCRDEMMALDYPQTSQPATRKSR